MFEPALNGSQGTSSPWISIIRVHRCVHGSLGSGICPDRTNIEESRRLLIKDWVSCKRRWTDDVWIHTQPLVMIVGSHARTRCFDARFGNARGHTLLWARDFAASQPYCRAFRIATQPCRSPSCRDHVPRQPRRLHVEVGNRISVDRMLVVRHRARLGTLASGPSFIREVDDPV